MPTDNTRSLKKIDFAHIITLTVTTGQASTQGFAQRITGAMTVQDDATGGDDVIGVALNTAASLGRVQVLLPGPVVPMKVGTGDCTRGKKQKTVATGITDAPATTNSGGTTTPILGIALESGVAGDVVGVVLTLGNRISA